MKHLIFTLLFIISNFSLSAQDTLYVKGKRKPLLVDIKIVKKKTLNYVPFGTKGLRTIALKKIRKINFGDDSKVVMEDEKQDSVVPKKEEFRSTILIQSGGIASQNQAGLNYMHRLSPAITEKISFWGQIGGGYHQHRTFRRNTKGYYFEFGTRLEFASLKDAQNRFYIGFDINNEWSKGTEFMRAGLIRTTGTESVDDNRIAVQIPIGYVYRGNNGVYISSGLEFSTLKLFPAINLRFGYCFGK